MSVYGDSVYGASTGRVGADLARLDDDLPLEHPDRILYSYYLRGTRSPIRGTRVDGWIALLAFVPFVTFLLLDPSLTSAVLALVIAGLAGVLRIYLQQPAPEIGIALTSTHVIVGAFGSDTRTIERSRIVSCVVSDRPWTGEELPAAAASWPVRKMRYLTLTCADSVAYNVAFDSGNLYAEHIHDVLRGAGDVLAPPALAAQFTSAQAAKERRAADVRSAAEARNAARGRSAQAAESRERDGASITLGRLGGTEDSTDSAHGSDSGVEQRLWQAAVRRHDGILLEYLPYETDPQLLLTYPSMSDVSVPETGEFVEALGEAMALRTETFPTSVPVSKAYRDAVKALAAAWTSAERRAKRVGTSLLEEPDRRRIEQAAKLLAHADSSTTPHERETYLRQVKSIVDDLVNSGAISAPPKVLREIDAATARAIEAARRS
ncbi:hypothetical protein [Cumulibacter soli]|uniref:hypothetical protein n=1 Tax=Cumulibacter soli TaxID=2546344 RepID=UPI001067E194|nr:hypothetical protein [Cumulibacter soli]